MIKVQDIIRFANAAYGPEVLEGMPLWLIQAQSQVFERTKMRSNYYRFLRRLVQECKPATVLELGVEFGLASAMMASVDMNGYKPDVIGVDKNWHNIPGDIVYNNCPNYHYLIGDTTDEGTVDTIKALMVEGMGKIGLVFQDSSHHYEASKREWELYKPLLAANAIWVCDDITPAFHDPKVDPPGKGMLQYWYDLPGHKILFPDILHKGNTVGVVML